MMRKFLIYLTLLIVVAASCYQIFGLLSVADKSFFAAYVAGAIMAYTWQAAARLIAKLRAKEEVR